MTCVRFYEFFFYSSIFSLSIEIFQARPNSHPGYIATGFCKISLSSDHESMAMFHTDSVMVF